MNFSNLFHQFATWSLRAAILGGIAGVVYLSMRGDADMPGARLTASQTGLAAPQAGSAAADVPPCRPIGHTANGELVYSMDCERLPGVPLPGVPSPGEPSAGAAAAATKAN